ncbi:unnamed protein product [Heterobilharzia americana]|nr:unnamed protein product [Heterobilharzia americana]
MPTRRKNVDLNRLRRSSKRNKICDLLSSSYVQYVLIFMIWGVLLLINQSTDMRFEYFWPGWLFICSIHDSLKFQGMLSSEVSNRSVILLFRFGQSCLNRLGRLAFGYFGTIDKHYSDFDSISNHSTCHTYNQTGSVNTNSPPIGNGTISNMCVTDTGRRRTIQCLESSAPTLQTNRRYAPDSAVKTDSHSKLSGNGCVSKQSNSGKPVRERGIKEDPVTRLENNVRRLRSEVQSMRALETQLRNQLSNLQRDDRLNRLSLSNQRQRNEAISSRISKLTNRCRNERSNLNTMEQNLNEEIRLRQLVEAQLAEINVIPVRNIADAGDSSVLKNSIEQSLQNPIPSIQASANDRISTNGDVMMLQPNATQNSVNTYCCKLRHLLESKLYTLRLTVKHRENLTLASKIRHSDQLSSKCLTNADLREVDTLSSGNSVHKYDAPPSSSKLQSGHLVGKDVYCGMLNTEAENLHNTNNSHDVQTNKHRHTFLENCFNSANEERERLANKLRTENWQKQELLTLYHTSVREITELNKTLKQRDLQILELTMKIEQLECLPKSTKSFDSIYHSGYAATTTTTKRPLSGFSDDFTKFRSGEKNFTPNKQAQQHISSMLSENTSTFFPNASSTHTLDSMLIHSTLERYNNNSSNSLQTSRLCVPSVTSPITTFTDLTGFIHPVNCGQTTFQQKRKQNYQNYFIDNKNHSYEATATFNTNCSSSCLLPYRTCSSSSSSSCSSNINYITHTDMQAFTNYTESPVISPPTCPCPSSRQKKDQKQQQRLAANTS